MDPKDPLQLDEGTYASKGGEIKAWSYYSQYAVAASTSPFDLFTIGLGGSGAYGRLDQTNFPANGMIPNSQKLVIKAIALEYVGGAAKADANMIAIRKWLASTVLQVSILDKSPMFQARVSRIMGLSLGLFNDPTTTAEPVSYTTREQVSPVFKLARPITITANSNFRLTVIPGVAAAAQQVTDVDLLNVDLFGDLWSRSG